VKVLSRKGGPCRIHPGVKVQITADGKRVKSRIHEDASIEFDTTAGGRYTLRAVQ